MKIAKTPNRRISHPRLSERRVSSRRVAGRDSPLTLDRGGTEGVSALARAYPLGHQLTWHVHPAAQLLFASSGMMQVTTLKGRWLVPPQRAVWLPAGAAHAVDMLTKVEMRTLYISPSWLSDQPEALRLQREFVVAVGPLLRETVLAFFASEADRRRSTLLAQLAIMELAEAEDAMSFVPLPADPRARRVAELILADPAGKRDMSELAGAAGASPRTISRLFPAQTSLTLKEWRQRARILAAVEAFGAGETMVKRVAARLGFASVAAFAQAFRQVMGMTPSAFVSSSRQFR